MLNDVTVAATTLMPLGNGVAPFLRHDVDKAAVLRELAERYGVHAQQRARRARVLRLGASTATGAAGDKPLPLPPPRSAACVLGHGAIWLLYLTRSNGPLNGGVCCLIGRRAAPGEFYPRVAFVHLRFDAPAFDGTVLEGELARGPDGAWAFAVCDVLVHRGRALEAGAPLPARLARAAHLVRHSYQPRDTDLFVVRRKRWLGAADLAAVRPHTAPHGWRALLWAPIAASGRRGGGGGNAALLVLLPPSPPRSHARADADERQAEEEEEAEAVDDEEEDLPPRTRQFWVRSTPLPDVYELHLDRLGALRSVGDGEGGVADASGLPMTAGVPSLSASQALAAALRAAAPDPAARVTLAFSTRFRKWIPCV